MDKQQYLSFWNEDEANISGNLSSTNTITSFRLKAKFVWKTRAIDCEMLHYNLKFWS